jgi:molecular chaperone GrpE (heat shock protein)
MIDEIQQLRQKTLDILKENHQLRQEIKTNKIDAENTILTLIRDSLELYDRSEGDLKKSFVGFLRKNKVTKIPMSTASTDNDFVKIVGTEAVSGKRNGIILSFVKEGFVWEQQVVRPAEVIVVKND